MKYIYQEELSNTEPFSGEKVLLVDDNKMNLEVTKSLLEKSGVSVDIAQNGEQAVTFFEQSPHYFYRIIFMDINMYGVNGYEAAKKIRSLERPDARGVPIFALSADVQMIHKEKAKEAGMNGYVCKPFIYKDVFALMHHVFEKYEGDKNCEGRKGQ